MESEETWHEISGPNGEEIQDCIPLGCCDDEFDGYKSKFRNAHEERGNGFLRNIYTYDTDQNHILFKRLDSFTI